MSNQSITIYTDNLDKFEFINLIKRGFTEKEVILNSFEYFNDICNKNCQMITIIDIDKSSFNKIKNRADFKRVKKAGHIRFC